MKNQKWTKRDPIKNYFPVPNEVFLLGLSPGELAVYSYLLFCEDRSTYQCWPSFKTIAKDGQKRNGNLLFTICPIQEAVEQFYQQQLDKISLDAQRKKTSDANIKQERLV